MPARAPRPYTNPYLAGIALGLVLLAAFVVAGRGLGASGAFGAVASGSVAAVAPARAQASPYLSRYLQAPAGPWGNWVLVEILGAMIGGYLSARFAGRLRRQVVRGPQMPVRARLITAASGGAGMGVGAIVAHGCTSGQALSGGALLSLGSWVFTLRAFASAYAAAPLFRRAWR